MITKLNSNLLDVTIHFTDNEHYYNYSVSEICDPKKEDFFKKLTNTDPIVCDVTCNNDLVSTVIHDYLDSDYIFEILEKLRLVHMFYKCIGSHIINACKCIKEQNYIQLNDCYTNQDLGIALAYERGIIDELNNIHSDIDYEHYFNFDAYGHDCRINEDWDYYDGSFWKFWNY